MWRIFYQKAKMEMAELKKTGYLRQERRAE